MLRCSPSEARITLASYDEGLLDRDDVRAFTGCWPSTVRLVLRSLVMADRASLDGGLR